MSDVSSFTPRSRSTLTFLPSRTYSTAQCAPTERCIEQISQCTCSPSPKPKRDYFRIWDLESLHSGIELRRRMHVSTPSFSIRMNFVFIHQRSTWRWDVYKWSRGVLDSSRPGPHSQCQPHKSIAWRPESASSLWRGSASSLMGTSTSSLG